MIDGGGHRAGICSERSGGGRRFRFRSVENILEEVKELYFKHGVRIFNFQDDNFLRERRISSEGSWRFPTEE